MRRPVKKRRAKPDAWQQFVRQAMHRPEIREAMREVSRSGIGYLPAARWTGRFCFGPDNSGKRELMLEASIEVFRDILKLIDANDPDWPKKAHKLIANEILTAAAAHYLLGTMAGLLGAAHLKEKKS